MPRYKYACFSCGYTKTYFHGINECIETCENCDKPSMRKDYSKMFTTTVKKRQAESKIGVLTKQYIEENKEILDDLKKKTKEQIYEPS